MRVVVTIEGRFLRTPDSAIWTETGHDYAFWAGLLTAFDHVRIVARLRDVPAPPPSAAVVLGPHVEFWPVPHYIGPLQYLARRAEITRCIRAAAAPDDAVILRVPSPIGSLLATHRERHGLPYAVIVVGDPWDVFAPGVVRHPLRPFFRRWAAAHLRRQCRTAIAARYVTEAYLQRRYPPRPGVVAVAASDVDLPEEAFVAMPRQVTRVDDEPTLVSVGSLAQPYKGIATLIDAVALLDRAGTSVRLVHVGDGRCRTSLEAQARRHGLGSRITFTGALLPGAPVRAHLDTADVFVMPSRTEGLPRALIEAMARGLPALGSAVGGIPELLDPECLVPPGDATRLADAIAGLLSSPERLTAASHRNLARSRAFARERLIPTRLQFDRAIVTALAGHSVDSRVPLVPHGGD